MPQATAWLEAGWLLTAILVPLAINLWARQPFEPPKAALLRTLAWLMAGLWLADCLLIRRSPWRELRGNRLIWPALAVAAAQTVATLLAADRSLSLWGSYERAQGLLTQLSYVLLFLVVSARLRTLEQARRLLATMVMTAVPLLALGLAQALGWQPAGLVSDARSPVLATLGRSNFLGAYLAMLLPLTAALALTARQRWLRLAAGSLAAGEIAVVALTLARGAWLAAGVAVGLFGLLWAWPRLKHGWRWAAVLGGLLVLAGGLVGALWLGSQGGSEAARLTIWQATLELISRRPLLGYGPVALGLAFPHVYPPQLVYYQGRGVMIDRAHNLLLDWAATVGVAGLLTGLWLMLAFFTTGWRALRQTADPERRAWLAACLAAVAGNVAGNLVSFDTTATATATALLMALIAGLTSPRKQGARGREQGTRDRRWAVAGLLLVGIGWAVVQANIRPLAADMAAQTAVRRAVAGDRPGAIEAGKRAVVLWPTEPTHRSWLSWACLQQAQAAASSPLPWLQQAEAELLAARDLRPGDYRLWAALGELYGLWGNRWDAGKLPLAHDAYRRATALAPNHAMLYTNWGMVYLDGGDLAGAAVKFRQAVNLDATDGYAFTHLGDAEFAQGHVAEALEAYRQAAHWEPGLVYAHLGLARCYRQLGQPEAAALALQQALQLDPDNPTALGLRQEMGLGP